jgi:tetratricopeptide (TPR) repeat protein
LGRWIARWITVEAMLFRLVRARFAVGVGAIVAVTVALYTPTLGHAFLIDDATYIVENAAVTRGVPLLRYVVDSATMASRPDFRWQSYRPVRTIGFRALVATCGVRPLPFGVANLLLYALAIVLVAQLLRRLVVDEAAALAATALWALLPVHVEPVVYASALGDHLSLVFQLLAFFAAARAVAEERGWIGLLLASVAAAALALGSKEMAVTEGGLLAVGAACAWRTLAAPARRRARAVIAAHGVVTIAYLILRTRVLGAVGQGTISGLTAQVAVRAIPIYLWKYVQVTLEPLGHAAAYAAVPLKRTDALFGWLGVGAIAIGLWRLRRPALTFAIAWYALSLLPVLHLVPLLAYYADRFALVPSVGLALAAAVALAATGGRARRWAFVATGVLSWVYAAGVLVEQRAWRSDATLWRWAVDAQPEAALAHSNLAIELLHEGAPAQALPHLEAVRRIRGSGGATLMQMAIAYDMLGRYDDAERTLRTLMVESTALPDSHALLASVLLRRGDRDGAARELAAALALAPELPAAAVVAAQLAEARGQTDEALAAYARAVAQSPSARYHAMYAAAALRARQWETARQEAAACLRKEPARQECARLEEVAKAATAPGWKR